MMDVVVHVSRIGSGPWSVSSGHPDHPLQLLVLVDQDDDLDALYERLALAVPRLLGLTEKEVSVKMLAYEAPI